VGSAVHANALTFEWNSEASLKGMFSDREARPGKAEL
jgi:hypothetical protein